MKFLVFLFLAICLLDMVSCADEALTPTQQRLRHLRQLRARIDALEDRRARLPASTGRGSSTRGTHRPVSTGSGGSHTHRPVPKDRWRTQSVNGLTAAEKAGFKAMYNSRRDYALRRHRGVRKRFEQRRKQLANKLAAEGPPVKDLPQHRPQRHVSFGGVTMHSGSNFPPQPHYTGKQRSAREQNAKDELAAMKLASQIAAMARTAPSHAGTRR